MENVVLVTKLKKRFGLIFADDAYYWQKINSYGKNYKLLVQSITLDLRQNWENQNIDWLIDYINQNIYNGLTAEVNVEQILDLVRLLNKFNLRISYYIFQILITECPILEDIFSSILGYEKEYDEEDITYFCNNSACYNILVYYCQFHHKWIGKTFSKTLIEKSFQRPINTVWHDHKEILAKTEERELLSKCHNGDEQARATLIRTNLFLVRSLAKNYAFKGIDPNDLIQEGTLALIEAIDQFDLTQDVKLSTFASVYIINAIKDLIYEKLNQFYLPHNIRYKYATLLMEQAKEENINYSALAQKLEISEKMLANLIKISKPVLNWEEVEEVEQYTEPIENEISLMEEVKEILAMLPTGHKDLIETFYGLNGKTALNRARIAQAKGVSRQAITQAIDNILIKITFLMYLKGYNISKFQPYLEQIPSYEKFSYHYLKEESNTDKLINKYVWIAYNLHLINYKSVICFFYIGEEDVIKYLTLMLTGQINFYDLKYLVKKQIKTRKLAQN